MIVLNPDQLKRLKSILDTLSINQLIWVSGYLSGLVTSKISENKLIKSCVVSEKKELENSQGSSKEIVIISASQTGNAHRIAKQLYNDFIKTGLKTIWFNAKDCKFKKIFEISFLIFITSTHGEGDPPEEAISLYKYLFSKKAMNMKNTNFTVLSLGDRSYKNFAKAGKDFDNRFAELGANRLYQRVDVDIDYCSEVSIWKRKIVSLFKEHIGSISCKNQCQNGQKKDILLCPDDPNFYDKESPLIARLLNKQKITSRNSIKDIHHLEIDISGSNLCYQPGDALGVWYENDCELINELLGLLGLKGDELINIPGKSIVLHEALKKYYELTQNTSIVIKNTAIITQNKKLLNLLKDQREMDFFSSTVPIVEMIRQMSIKLTAQELSKVLRPIRPRFYSISSAQSEVGEEIHITVSVVRYKVNGRLRSGGASSYLVDRLQEDDKLRIFVEPNNNFRLPKNSNTPIIMIGAGTGIAPFRSFIQQRALDKESGKNWLFFGNLKFIDDFLYQTEWKQYFKDGILDKIDTAWSRDQDHKIYVQDKLLQNSSTLWSWIQEGAHIYVCGDAKYMACDVEKALNTLTSKCGNMDINQVNNFWDNMRIQNRYQRDVY